MDLQLSGQAAIVTGSSRGLGAAMARALAREGVSVVINHLGDTEGAESVRQEIEAGGGAVVVREADVRDRAAAGDLAQFAVDRFGRLDILVNNAGVMARTPFVEASQEEFDHVIGTNLRGTWNCSQAAARHMIQRRYGRILNCSSLAAFVPSTGHAAYASSKAGIIGLTKVMAGELAPHNILVNVYVPGTMDAVMAWPAIEDRRDELTNNIALRRFGRPEELASLVVFLVSPVNSYMSGAIIHLDGGKFSLQNATKPWRDAGLIP